MIGENHTTVLITAAGTATAVNIIKCLAKMPGVRIITTDSNPTSMIAAPVRWQTTHYQVPLAGQREAYISRLIEICESEFVDALYPIHDAEILAVAEMRSSFPERVRLPSLTPASVLNSNDKWINFNICRESDLPTPGTILGSDLNESMFARQMELIRKPRRGVGSVGVRRIANFGFLDSKLDLIDEVIFQAPCQGTEFTVDVLKINEMLIAVARERIETKSGVSTKARVFVDPWLTKLAQRIASVFALEGLFCFQVIGDLLEQDVHIIDINPRCGGGTALSSAAGFPLYEAYFAHILNLQTEQAFREACIERASRQGQTIVCRYYEEVVTHTS